MKTRKLEKGKSILEISLREVEMAEKATVQSGIYIITNTESGRVYIGSTIYLKTRIRHHRACLRGGYHGNSRLQHAWNKHGEVTFKFGVLEYLDGPDELFLAEQWWMDVYRLEGKKLYNFGLAAQSSRLGRPHTEETRRKIGRANKGKPSKLKGRELAEEHRRKIGEANAGSYPVFIHYYTGEIIPAGVNLSAMCRERGLCQSSMTGVARGRFPHHRGWMLQPKYFQLRLL